jgi:RNA polymerase sigma-70 factor (ECF subfamily)
MAATQLDTAGIWSHLSVDLRRFIRRRVPDDHAADDLLQETFIRIHRGLPELDDKDRLVAWVYRIARNVLTDFYRKRTPDVGVNDEFVEAPVLDSQSRFMASAGKWLDEIIASLPDTYREAVRLSELEGVGQNEVADRLGLTLSGAKSRIQRGRMLLKNALLGCCRFDLDQRGNVVDCDPLPHRTVCLDCGDLETRPK